MTTNYDYDLAVIGGGPAGLAAALAARQSGVEKIIIFEREHYLGGILQQCIHNGFGLEYFKEELTGPEYASRFIQRIKQSSVEVKTDTMVIDINRDRAVIALNRRDGLIRIKCRSVLLAMGCCERTREAVRIPGTRPAGIFTAGTAQRYVNIEGHLPGKKVVILGSGDIGLIMARRMTLEGAEIKGVLEIMPYSSGLVRNKVQCLDDFNIPLKLKHTITRIKGKKRVEAVEIAQVDDQLKPVPGTEEEIECDTVLLSVGLIPENELSTGMGIKLDKATGGPGVNEHRETNREGVFACGNVLQVHDLVDYVTEEGEIAGQAVSRYLAQSNQERDKPIKLIPGNNVRYVVPQKIEHQDSERKSIKLYMRVTREMEGVELSVTAPGGNLLTYQKSIVTPGEIVTVVLPEKLLDEDLNRLTISIQKKEGEGDV